VWGYISLGYFKQRTKAGEVGSSTMPHKVNPIDFENAEGNFGLANALLTHLSQKLPISRWQRDLTDSTVLRNMGVALGYALLGYDSLAVAWASWSSTRRPWLTTWTLVGSAGRAHPDRDAPLRLPNPYERLKELTRGKAITKRVHPGLHRDPGAAASREGPPAAMTPGNYIGKAVELARGSASKAKAQP
jgi:adenylosuccinate lyase